MRRADRSGGRGLPASASNACKRPCRRSTSAWPNRWISAAVSEVSVSCLTRKAYQDPPSGSADRPTLSLARGRYSPRRKSCSVRYAGKILVPDPGRDPLRKPVPLRIARSSPEWSSRADRTHWRASPRRAQPAAAASPRPARAAAHSRAASLPAYWRWPVRSSAHTRPSGRANVRNPSRSRSRIGLRLPRSARTAAASSEKG